MLSSGAAVLRSRWEGKRFLLVGLKWLFLTDKKQTIRSLGLKSCLCLMTDADPNTSMTLPIRFSTRHTCIYVVFTSKIIQQGRVWNKCLMWFILVVKSQRQVLGLLFTWMNWFSVNNAISLLALWRYTVIHIKCIDFIAYWGEGLLQKGAIRGIESYTDPT